MSLSSTVQAALASVLTTASPPAPSQDTSAAEKLSSGTKLACETVSEAVAVPLVKRSVPLRAEPLTLGCADTFRTLSPL